MEAWCFWSYFWRIWYIFGGFTHTWRRLLFDVGLVILEAYIWCPSFTMLSLEDFATCWRPWSWCPSFRGSCLWSTTLGDDSWLMHLEAWEVFALVDFWRLMMLCCDLDEDWWLETSLNDDLETWHLTWWYLELDLKILGWISRTLFICLGLELTMTRMDDVTSSRWWSDRCICSGSDNILCSSLQAGSCTLWGLDSSNPSWLDPREH